LAKAVAYRATGSVALVGGDEDDAPNESPWPDKKQNADSFRGEMVKLTTDAQKEQFSQGMYRKWFTLAEFKPFATLLFGKLRQTLRYHHANCKVTQMVEDKCPTDLTVTDVAQEIVKRSLPATEDGLLQWRQLTILESIEEVFWDVVTHEVAMYIEPGSCGIGVPKGYERVAKVQASANARTN